MTGKELRDKNLTMDDPFFPPPGTMVIDPASAKKLAIKPNCAQPQGKPTICDPRLRTTNSQAECGSPLDYLYYSPWRAPGAAPTPVDGKRIKGIIETNAQGVASFYNPAIDVPPVEVVTRTHPDASELICLWLLPSLLNHSCEPSVANCVDARSSEEGGPVLRLFAARDLPAGAELTDTYVNLVAPLEARQAELETQKGFRCACARCVPSPFSGDASGSCAPPAGAAAGAGSPGRCRLSVALCAVECGIRVSGSLLRGIAVRPSFAAALRRSSLLFRRSPVALAAAGVLAWPLRFDVVRRRMGRRLTCGKPPALVVAVSLRSGSWGAPPDGAVCLRHAP